MTAGALLLAGCAGTGATATDDEPASVEETPAAAEETVEPPVPIADFVQGAWDCDARGEGEGEEAKMEAAITRSSLSFEIPDLGQDFSTTYTLDTPTTATTGDGWQLSAEQVDGPKVGEPLQVLVNLVDGERWLLDMVRTGDKTMEGTLTTDYDETNKDVIDLSCTRVA